MGIHLLKRDARPHAHDLMAPRTQAGDQAVGDAATVRKNDISVGRGGRLRFLGQRFRGRQRGGRRGEGQKYGLLALAVVQIAANEATFSKPQSASNVCHAERSRRGETVRNDVSV